MQRLAWCQGGNGGGSGSTYFSLKVLPLTTATFYLHLITLQGFVHLLNHCRRPRPNDDREINGKHTDTRFTSGVRVEKLGEWWALVRLAARCYFVFATAPFLIISLSFWHSNFRRGIIFASLSFLSSHNSQISFLESFKLSEKQCSHYFSSFLYLLNHTPDRLC